MSSVTGSHLAFFANGNASGSNINIALTDGTTVPTPMPGEYNIEVFTAVPPGGIFNLAPGFQASAYIDGASQAAGGLGLPLPNNQVQAGALNGPPEQLLDGSYLLVDQTGSETIQMVGDGTSADSVVGSSNDTISDVSTVAGNSLFVDASGVNSSSKPGPETINGGLSSTTVWGGNFDSITGGGAPMTVVGAVGGPRSHMTITGGAGGLAAFDFGQHNTISGGGQLTTIDDTYGAGGQNLLVGGSGASTFIAGASGDTLVGGSGPVTVLDAAVAGFPGQTVEGTTGLALLVEGGSNDSIVAGGSIFAFISAVSGSTIVGGTNSTGVTQVFALGDKNTVTGGAGTLVVGAAATNSSISGGSGNLNVFGLGKGSAAAGNTVIGSTAGTSSINDASGSFAHLTGGSGASTIIAGANDSIVGGAGTLEARIRSTLGGSEQVTLSGAASVVRDVDVGKGAALATVTGFNTAIDVIASSTSVVAGGGTGSGALVLGASASQVGADTVITFADNSKMTLLGTTLNNINFIQ